MYDFITHTWNVIKGKCFHDCSYCYMKRWGKQKPTRFDINEFNTNLGINNFIFIGSSNDIFADNIPSAWIFHLLNFCNKFYNKYLFQTKNPNRFLQYRGHPVFEKSVFCTTLETDNHFDALYGRNTPSPCQRAAATKQIKIPKYITIEPIMKFNLNKFIELIKRCEPIQVNIGADSGNNNLPEPNRKEIENLIDELDKFTIIKQKKNLWRLMK